MANTTSARPLLSRSIQGNGHFPCCARRREQCAAFCTVSIDTSEEQHVTLAASVLYSDIFLQNAWALLLRSYIRDDCVSFIKYPDYGVGKQEDGDRQADGIAPEDPKVLEYWLPPHLRLRDVQSLPVHEIAHGSLFPNTVNTAVNFAQQSVSHSVLVCVDLSLTPVSKRHRRFDCGVLLCYISAPPILNLLIVRIRHPAMGWLSRILAVHDFF